MNFKYCLHRLALSSAAAMLAACGSTVKLPPMEDKAVPPSAAKSSPPIPKLPPANSGRGGYYQDDGPGENPPDGLENLADAEPKVEPLLPRANRPYVVFGKKYIPITHDLPFKQRGKGSWYGKKFHGQRTSSGEIYDMYKMTAAHPTLPIPSYVRVTNVKNGTQVIVRVNDRGPFHAGRVIDLSYTAALKLGYIGQGSAELEVERLLPDEIARIAAARKKGAQLQATPGVMTMPVVAPVIERTSASSDDEPVSATMPAANVAASPAQQAEKLASPIASSINSFYLQFGAFKQADNAQVARDGYQKKWRSELPAIEILEQASLYRLYSGPYSSRDDADKAASLAEDAGLPKPVIVQR
jgi:rare lipoprotein A